MSKEKKAKKTLFRELVEFVEANGIEKGKAGYLLGLFEKHKAIEYANQQPEQWEVDIDAYLKMHTLDPMEKISNSSDGWMRLRDILIQFQSTLTQDKVREAAEKAFNQARKQTSMLGEKDVQMTDYLISPKYKTFDDYWNSKKH